MQFVFWMPRERPKVLSTWTIDGDLGNAEKTKMTAATYRIKTAACATLVMFAVSPPGCRRSPKNPKDQYGYWITIDHAAIFAEASQHDLVSLRTGGKGRSPAEPDRRLLGVSGVRKIIDGQEYIGLVVTQAESKNGKGHSLLFAVHSRVIDRSRETQRLDIRITANAKVPIIQENISNSVLRDAKTRKQYNGDFVLDIGDHQFELFREKGARQR